MAVWLVGKGQLLKVVSSMIGPMELCDRKCPTYLTSFLKLALVIQVDLVGAQPVEEKTYILLVLFCRLRVADEVVAVSVR
jgi:hypothetical protein